MMSGFINTISGPSSNRNSVIMHPPAIPTQSMVPYGMTSTAVPNGQPVTVQVARLGESQAPPYANTGPLDSFYSNRENNFPPARNGQSMPGTTILNLYPQDPEQKKVQFDEVCIFSNFL